MATGVGLAGVSAPFFFAQFDRGHPMAFVVWMCLICTFAGIFSGPLPGFIVAQFPKSVRTTSIAVAWTVSSMVFASTVGIVTTFIRQGFEEQLGLYPDGLYLAAIACIAVIGIAMMDGHKRQVSLV